MQVGEPRRFTLERRVDETGVSGTGTVATGVQWPDGTCAMRWSSEHRSTAIYDTLADLCAIHGHGGLTNVKFLDDVEWGTDVSFDEVEWTEHVVADGS